MAAPPEKSEKETTVTTEEKREDSISGDDLGDPSQYHDKVLYIHTHWGLTKEIKIEDITSLITAPFDNMGDAFRENVKQIAKDSAQDQPVLSVFKNNFIGSRHTVVDNRASAAGGGYSGATGSEASTGSQVAKVKTPYYSGGTSRLSFPQGSPHSSHDIEMKPIKFMRREERFVMDSVEYRWKIESRVSHTKLALVRQAVGGSGEKEVARYYQSHSFRSGGWVILDTKEVDEVVVAVTCCCMLKKKRMRQQERGSSAGAVAGGTG